MPALLAHIGTAGGGWLLALVAGAAPALGYVCGVTRFNTRMRCRWTRWRTASFLVGCALITVAVSPPFEAAASSATGHVRQHLVLGMYSPVALVLGAPVTLVLGASTPRHRRRLRELLRLRVLRVPTHIWVATALSTGGMYALYLTPLYALSTRLDPVHHLTHVHFLVTGYLFAWSVAGGDPIPHRAPLPWRVTALIVGGAGHGVLAKLLYSAAPSLPPDTGLSRADLETASQWMYYGGHLTEAALAVALFAGWYRRIPRIRTGRRAWTGQVRPSDPVDRTADCMARVHRSSP